MPGHVSPSHLYASDVNAVVEEPFSEWEEHKRTSNKLWKIFVISDSL